MSPDDAKLAERLSALKENVPPESVSRVLQLESPDNNSSPQAAPLPASPPSQILRLLNQADAASLQVFKKKTRGKKDFPDPSWS